MVLKQNDDVTETFTMRSQTPCFDIYFSLDLDTPKKSLLELKVNNNLTGFFGA